MNADQMYTEIILSHNKSGHNKREVPLLTVVERGHNPNCGDDLTLQLRVEEGTIVDAGFLGSGCAISQSSMSIMIDLVKGRPVDWALALVDDFFLYVHGEAISPEALERLEDAQAFGGLSKMPARIKCGTLGWHCLKTSLNRC